MQKISPRQALALVQGLHNEALQRDIIKQMLESGEISEIDIARIEAVDADSKAEEIDQLLKKDDLMRWLWVRFAKYPKYLARALVRTFPDLFYSFGFAFRVIPKIRTDLGTVAIPPHRPKDASPVYTFLERLAEEVRLDLRQLDIECRMREYMFFMSTAEDAGLQTLIEDIENAKDEYDRNILEAVLACCEKLLSLEFPAFVDTIDGYPFPSFHVRWWIDRTQQTKSIKLNGLTSRRILNIGDTGSQKTAFSVVTMEHLEIKKVLVICAANARAQWKKEIARYYRDPADRAYLISNAEEVKGALETNAQFVIVAYTTLIQDEMVQQLLRIPFEGLIQDECQYAKKAHGTNPSQRGRACRQIIDGLKLKVVLPLSATPWENKPQEMAATASILRPDLFPDPEVFISGRVRDPRFIRELFAKQILDIESWEIKDQLYKVTPDPREDLFGVTMIDMSPEHTELYEFAREDDELNRMSPNKIDHMLVAAVHPHAIRDCHDWPDHLQERLNDWRISSKLVWIRDRLEKELAEGAKAVVATGVFVRGVTRPLEKDESEEEIWVGRLLKEWFGEESVLILDAKVSQTLDGSESSKRHEMIKTWRTDPKARILLVSMRTCPDSINLSVPKLPGITKLFITALSYWWVPWKQFLGRFNRAGQGVDISIEVPILRDTVEVGQLKMLRDKWDAQLLFRAGIALTEKDMACLSTVDREGSLLAQLIRTNIQHVNMIGSCVQANDEKNIMRILDSQYGEATNGEIFARAFFAEMEQSTSGHIARFMEKPIRGFIREGLVDPDGTTILDAGCGAFRVERMLELPVYGVDMNPSWFMIPEIRNSAPHQGKNAKIGYLSKLQEDWTHKFQLVIASLVLDWTSKKQRLGILNNLVRVCHQHGMVWITLTYTSLSEDLLTEWCEALQEQGMMINHEMTGLVMSTKKTSSSGTFSFWSLLFSPNGSTFTATDIDRFRFWFELSDRTKKQRGRTGCSDQDEKNRDRTVHDNFEVIHLLTHEKKNFELAGQDAAVNRVNHIIHADETHGWRFHSLPDCLAANWRALEQLRKRGLTRRLEELGLV